MEKKLKIGQRLVITEDFKIEGALSGSEIDVKKGDEGFIDKSGNLHYTTGKAQGKIQHIKEEIGNSVDVENVANLIFKRLKSQFEISDYLDNYDIPEKDFVDEIAYVLDEIF
jgi:hypothetical protein